MKITNGSIGYSHVLKVEDYGVNKRAETTLSFTVDENEDVTTAIATVTKLVKANVSAMLGRAVAATPATPAPQAAPVVNDKPATVNDKEALAKAAGVSQDDQAKINAAAEAGLTRRPGPRKPKPETAAPPVADAAAVTEEDEFAATPEAPPAKEIPDADLNAAMTKKNAEIKSSKLIRELVGSFAPAGHTGVFHASSIPQAQRPTFLAKLKELKPAA